MDIDIGWLIPVAPSPGLVDATRAALVDQDLDYRIVPHADVRDQLDRSHPEAAIIQGGPLQPSLLEVQRWLHEFDVPTLVLLERLTDHHEALLLGRGVHDVVRAPTTSRRLRSRIMALHRRRKDDADGTPRSDEVLCITPHLALYPQRRLVTMRNHPVTLTKTEYELLLALARRRSEVVTRDELARDVGRHDLTQRALESHVSRLRIKLRAGGEPRLVESVRGVGYRLAWPADWPPAP